MKLTIVGKDYLLIEPCSIVKKSKSNLVYNPKAGITSTVITYKVLDDNKHPEFKNKIIGCHRANVFPFSTLEREYHIVDIKAVVFIATPDEDEKTMDEKAMKEDLNPKTNIIM